MVKVFHQKKQTMFVLARVAAVLGIFSPEPKHKRHTIETATTDGEDTAIFVSDGLCRIYIVTCRKTTDDFVFDTTLSTKHPSTKSLRCDFSMQGPTMTIFLYHHF